MDKLFCILFLFFWGVKSQAQPLLGDEGYADSLEHLLATSKNDSVKARLNYLLSDYWSYSDTAKTKVYLREGKKFSKNNAFLNGLYAYYIAGYFFDINIDESIKGYLKAEKLFAKLPTKEANIFQAKSWRNYAVLQQRKDNETEMVNVLLNKAIPLVQKAGAYELEGNYYIDVGLVFMNQLMHSKAETYFNKGISILNKTTPKLSSLFTALDNNAKNYCYMDSMQKAAPLLKKMEQQLAPFPNSEYNIDFAMTQSIYFRKTNQFNKALQSLEKGIGIAKKLNKKYLQNGLQFQRYKTLTGLSRYKEAKEVLHYVIDNTSLDFMENSVMYAYEMSETYNHLKDIPNAYAWLKKYSVLRDTMYIRNLKAEMSNMEIKFNKVENEKRISLLQSENKQEALKAKNAKLANTLLLVLCLIILITLIFIGALYFSSRKLAAQKEMNYNQQLKEMEQQRKIGTNEAMLEGEERERRRVARDLHDGLGGMLAGIKIKLSGHAAQQRSYLRNDQQELDKIIDQLDNSVSELRRIARNMMPESLIRFGLQTAIKDLCESMLSKETTIRFAAFDLDETMELSTQVIIYRIIQEALTNSIRHARAKNIMVQCSQNENHFYITVEDDGIGFAVLVNQKGMGLINIENRVKYLNGKMDVSSVPNEGTTINMELNVAA